MPQLCHADPYRTHAPGRVMRRTCCCKLRGPDGCCRRQGQAAWHRGVPATHSACKAAHASCAARHAALRCPQLMQGFWRAPCWCGHNVTSPPAACGSTRGPCKACDASGGGGGGPCGGHPAPSARRPRCCPTLPYPAPLRQLRAHACPGAASKAVAPSDVAPHVGFSSARADPMLPTISHSLEQPSAVPHSPPPCRPPVTSTSCPVERPSGPTQTSPPPAPWLRPTTARRTSPACACWRSGWPSRRCRRRRRRCTCCPPLARQVRGGAGLQPLQSRVLCCWDSRGAAMRGDERQLLRRRRLSRGPVMARQ